jgi:hypothetical protein
MADETKNDLIRELERARSQAAVNRRALANDLRLGPRIRKSFERNKGAWIGGSIVFGLLISRLTVRPRKARVVRGATTAPADSKVEKELKTAGVLGLLIPVAKVAFDMARPALTKWATRWIEEWSDGRRR